MAQPQPAMLTVHTHRRSTPASDDEPAVAKRHPTVTPPVQQWPGVVILSGPALRDAYFLVSAGIRSAARTGYPTTRFEAIRRAIKDADLSPQRHSDVAQVSDAPHCGGGDEAAVDSIDTAEAAALLGCSRRSCQRKAAAGLGRRVGGRWVLDRGLVAAEAQARKENR
jgi:hypothetical protein